MKHILIPTSLAAALALAGCASLGGFASPAQSPLAYAPVGSAFVFGNLTAPPKEYAELNARWYQQINTGIVQSLVRFQQISAEIFEDPTAHQRADAFAQVLIEQLSQPEGWAALGLDVNARAALYEVNALPVLRIELGDKTRLEDFIKAIEIKAGVPFARSEVDGQAFWHSATPADADTAISPRLVVAIVGRHLVLTVDSQHASTPLLAQLGVKKPVQSVVDTGVIEALNTQYGFQPGMASGYIDLQRVLTLATDAEHTQPWIAGLLHDSDAPLSASCQSELGAIVAKAPRIVGGATELLQPDLKINVVWELEPNLAKDWSTLPAPVQGLDNQTRGNLVFGAGVNLSATATFLQKQAAAIAAKPYECELLEPLNELAAEANSGIAALYAASSWVQGFRAQLSTFDPKTEDVTGNLLLASPNPVGLIGMAQGFMPELGKLGLMVGGPAMPLVLSESSMLSGWDQPAWAIVGKSSVGVAVGANEKAQLEQDIQAPTPAVPPLLYFGSKGDTIAALFSAFEEDEVAPLTDSPWEKWYNFVTWPITASSSELYKEIEYMDMQWLATERGLEFPQTVVFKPLQAKAK